MWSLLYKNIETEEKENSVFFFEETTKKKSEDNNKTKEEKQGGKVDFLIPFLLFFLSTDEAQ